MIINVDDWVYFDQEQVSSLDSEHYEGLSSKLTPEVSTVELCELLERALRRIDLPSLEMWNAVGDMHADIKGASPSKCFYRGEKYPLCPPLSIRYLSVHILLGLFHTLFLKNFLDPSAPIITNPNIGLGYGDSTMSGGMMRKTWLSTETVWTLSATKHTVGPHIFVSMADWTVDTELKSVSVPGFEVPVRMPAHGIAYHPEGYSDVDKLPPESSSESSSTPTDDGYERIYGKHTTTNSVEGSNFNLDGDGLRDIPIHKFRMALRNMYPTLRYYGGDPENSHSDTSSLTPTQEYEIERQKYGDVEWGDVGVYKSVSNNATYLYLCPKITYEWNYWFEKNLIPTATNAWGSMTGADALRQIFTPPLLDAILPNVRFAEGYEDSGGDWKYVGYPFVSSDFTGIRNYLLEKARDWEDWDEEQAKHYRRTAAAVISNDCPNVQIPTFYESVPISRHSDTRTARIYTESIESDLWISPALWITAYKSFDSWLNRFRYSIYTLDSGNLQYALNASINVRSIDEYTWGSDNGTYRGSIRWEGTSMVVGMGQYLDGLRVDGPFNISLPSTRASFTAITELDQYTGTIKSYTGAIYTDTSDGERHIEIDGGPYDVDTPQKYETRNQVDASVIISNITPLRKKTGRVSKGGTAQYEIKQWYEYSSASTGGSSGATPDRHSISDEGTDATAYPLITSGNLRQMNKCTMYAIVKIVIENRFNSASATFYTRQGEYGEFRTSEEDWTTSSGQAPSESGITAYRLLNLGSPNQDGTFAYQFDPYALVNSVMNEHSSFNSLAMFDELKDYLKPSNIWKGYYARKSAYGTPYISFIYDSEDGMVLHSRDDVTRIIGRDLQGKHVYISQRVENQRVDISLDKAFLVIDWNFDRGGDQSQSHL